MSGFFSRGFTGRRRVPEEMAARLPPGQYHETGFPVLTAGPTPRVDWDAWTFEIDGLVARPRAWTSVEFAGLPFETVPCDIHCVTKWSRLDTSFGGVSMDVFLDAAEPRGSFVLVRSAGGYTTNLALDDLTGGKAWIVTQHEGEPLTREHGGPARLLVPISTSGRARSGSPACACSSAISLASGSATATTGAATRGASSAIAATDDTVATVMSRLAVAHSRPSRCDRRFTRAPRPA